MAVRVNPVVGVSELIIRITPGAVAEFAISRVGQNDKPLLVTGVLAGLALAFWYAGRAAARSMVRPQIVFIVLAAIGAVAVLTRPHARSIDVIPVVVGGLVWLALLPWLIQPLRHREDASRRSFLIRAGVVVVGAGVLATLGDFLGRGRRRVEEIRRLLKLPITERAVPPAALLDVDGLAAWRTANVGFYQISTTIVSPAIDPNDWTLRIHGMVDHEITLSYRGPARPTDHRGLDHAQLCLQRGRRRPDRQRLVERGPDRRPARRGRRASRCRRGAADLRGRLDLRHPARGTDRRPQRDARHRHERRARCPSITGSRCGRSCPVSTATCRRPSGWSTSRSPGSTTSRPTGPSAAGRNKVRSSSRPASTYPTRMQKVAAGSVTVAGSAWEQHTGIEAVEVSLDGGPWQATTLGGAPNKDTWVQWKATLDGRRGRPRAAGPGDRQAGAGADRRQRRRRARWRDRLAHHRIQR